VSEVRARRAIVFFLLILTLIVLSRAVSSARGAALPAAEPAAAAARLAQTRVALYDPQGRAAPVLRALGMAPRIYDGYESLALAAADLIVIGPGGFVRGDEGLGPILAARARGGGRVLILDQPNLPGTLSEDLRLWPSFLRAPDSQVLVAAGHPVLRGLSGGEDGPFLASLSAQSRPLLPPVRGNFRVLAEIRTRVGASWQEGIALLEFPVGTGIVLAAQAALCDDFPRDPRARTLLSNALLYLLDGHSGMKRTCLYAGSEDDLPACLAPLRLPVLPPPRDFEGVDLLIVPGDWSAPQHRNRSGLPPLARVARFLHEGGTVLLLNPQSLVADYLRGLLGEPVRFDPPDRSLLPADVRTTLPDLPLLQGIAAADLALLARPRPREFRLEEALGNRAAPLLIAPGLSSYRVGRGRLVALTLPDADECAAMGTSSLLSRLLTNLGVPLDHRPGIDPEAVTLLNE
jgi:hypothetical protein